MRKVNRATTLALVSFSLGCTAPSETTERNAARVQGEFVGEFDPVKGAFTVRMVGASGIAVDARPVPQARSHRLRGAVADEQFTVLQDGDPDCNTAFNTVDLVTNEASLGPSTCASNPSQTSWGGEVSISNYFPDEYLCNVWVAIDTISDPARAACDAPDHWPPVPIDLAAV